MQISDWLKRLGLGEYTQRFAESYIDASVLRDLTDPDLEKIGIPLGHRKKMLRAIAELPDAALGDKAAAESPRQDEAERRHLTVLFADLVGSTSLSARLDPEDLREIIGAYHRRCAEMIAKSGGFVAKYMGDGVLAYFGYPQAHEDDAERAVRAGLALVEAVAKLDAGAGKVLRARVGIATGLVVVGDLLGEGEAQERGVVGETPNLAARLQSLAEPSAVVIASSTRELVGHLFDYRDLGAIEIKGFAEAVHSWQVLGESAVESRFEALRATTTALVGRDEEMDLLMRRWQQVKSGEGRAVLLIGEPGIGKSRITAALQQYLQAAPYTRLRYFCSPHHQDSPLHPFIGQLERAAGFARDDTAEEKLAKLEALLTESNATPEEIGYIAELLSIPNARYPLPGLSPQKRKEKTLTSLLAQLERMAARRPVLVVYEDVHWIDATTLEILTLALERVQHLPVLLLVTARPEFRQPWPAYAHVTNITLGRIGREQGISLIQQVTGGKALPSEVLEEILARTDGVPLFMEELTKAVIESGVLTDAGDRFTVPEPLPPLAIPTSLNASLLARLDRLAPVREVAQIGAALGRQFSHELISAVAPMPAQQLNDGLAQLVSTELIFQRGSPPDAEYTFKHALVQDAAYSTLLRSRRQQLHARIGSTLETQFPDIVEAQPELLGQHFSQGGFEEKAITYWSLAGERAVKRASNSEAIRHFRRALELLEGPPETAERRKAELRVLAKLGPALQAARGFGAWEVETTYLRARELCDQLREPIELFQALWGLWLHKAGRDRWGAARRDAEELLAVAERVGDQALLLEAHHAMSPSALWVGEPEASRRHGEQGMTLYDRDRHRSLAFVYGGHDPGVCCRMHSGTALWFLGFPKTALERSRTGRTLARELSHTYTIVNTLPFVAMIHQLRGEVDAVRDLAESLIALSTEHGFPHWLAFGRVLDNWVHAAQGRSGGPVAQLRGAIGEYRAMGNEQYVPYFLGLLAATQQKYDEPAGGLDAVAEALVITEEKGSWLWDPELHRLRGELLLASNPGGEPEAEAAFRDSIDIARRQSAKSWELRGATSLARLLHRQGKRDEARRTLVEVYEWFTEGFDTSDLRDAKRLLDELSAAAM